MSKKLRAGVAIVDISPKEGIELAGYPHFPRHNTGIHDPLYASCIYLDNECVKVALVSLDLLFFSKKYVMAVRKRISEKTKIPPQNIMIFCTHTHSGPWCSGRLDIEALEKGLKPDEEYMITLQDKIVELVCEAYNNTFEAKIGIDKGYCGKEQGVGGNRLDPNGLYDPDVWVLGVKDMDDRWRAIMVEYALHPTVIHAESTLVTADYPGYIRKYFSHTKPDAVFLFAQGTSGNLSTRYFRKAQDFEEACRIGTTIAIEADRVLNSMELFSEVELQVKSEEVDVDLKILPSREEAEKAVIAARKELEDAKLRNAPYTEIRSTEVRLLGAENLLGYVLMREKGRKIDLLEDEIPAEVQGILIGDAVIIGLQGEIFVEYGLKIKSESINKKTIVVELANGCLPGYLCTQESYLQGGYEANTSLLTARTGDNFVNASLKLIKELREKES